MKIIFEKNGVLVYFWVADKEFSIKSVSGKIISSNLSKKICDLMRERGNLLISAANEIEKDLVFLNV